MNERGKEVVQLDASRALALRSPFFAAAARNPGFKELDCWTVRCARSERTGRKTRLRVGSLQVVNLGECQQGEKQVEPCIRLAFRSPSVALEVCDAHRILMRGRVTLRRLRRRADSNGESSMPKRESDISSHILQALTAASAPLRYSEIAFS